MSLLTRNHHADDVVGVRSRAMQRAQRALPAAKNAIPRAKQVVPLAMNAPTVVRLRAEEAATWARPVVDDVTVWVKPRVDDVRSWAAPRLERSGMAVQDSIAPAISEALISAAHRLDTRPAPRRRRWAGPLGITMMAAAAATAALAVAMRRRPVMVSYPPADIDPGDMPSSPGMPGGQHLADADGSQPDTEVNGQSREA